MCSLCASMCHRSISVMWFWCLRCIQQTCGLAERRLFTVEGLFWLQDERRMKCPPSAIYWQETITWQGFPARAKQATSGRRVIYCIQRPCLMYLFEFCVCATNGDYFSAELVWPADKLKRFKRIAETSLGLFSSTAAGLYLPQPFIYSFCLFVVSSFLQRPSAGTVQPFR